MFNGQGMKITIIKAVIDFETHFKLCQANALFGSIELSQPLLALAGSQLFEPEENHIKREWDQCDFDYYKQTWVSYNKESSCCGIFNWCEHRNMPGSGNACSNFQSETRKQSMEMCQQKCGWSTFVH